MASIPLAALGVKPPAPQDPTEPIQRFVALKSLLQQQAMQNLQLQKGTMELNQEKNLQSVFQNAAKTNTEPSQEQVLAASPTMGAKILLDRMNMKKAATDITKNQGEIEEQGMDYLGGMARGIQKDAKNPDGTFDLQKIQTILGTANGTPFADKVQQFAPQVMQMAKQSPEQFNAYLSSLVGRSPKWSQVESQERQARARELQAGKTTTGQLLGMTLGDKASQFNAAMSRRWQVMHPGEQLPPDFQLKPDSTYFDFQNIDKVLNGEETASLGKEQKDATLALRQQMYELAAQREDEFMNTQGSQMVTGKDPKTGKTIFTSMSDALAHGMSSQDFTKVGQGIEATKPVSAAKLQELLDSNDPNNPGILQLIHRIASRGHLGVLATRFNDFMAGKVGATADPDFPILRAKMDYSRALMTNVHFGSRGGTTFIDHMQQLADEKKSDAKTLLSGLKGEYEYAQTVAGTPSWKPQTRPSSVFDAPIAGLAKYHFKGQKGQVFSNDGQTWYDEQGNQINAPATK